MYQNDVASPACITSHAILDYFSVLFYGDTPPVSIASTFLAIDDWWYVPREAPLIRKSLVRARRAYVHYNSSGVLPTYVMAAYMWSNEHHFGRAVQTHNIKKSIQ